jgi:phosphoglycerate dehydrogenase-like enzyme
MDRPSTSTIATAMPAHIKSLLEPDLPAFVRPYWYQTVDEALADAPQVEIAWYDRLAMIPPAIAAAPNLRWVTTIAAGVDHFPIPLLQQRGVRLTNGVGLNADVVADYAVMGILTGAKAFVEVLRAQDRREWLENAPSDREMDGTSALIIGYGSIGKAVGTRLSAFGVKVTGVRSRAYPGEATLGPDDWRARLGEFDWIVLAAPDTSQTKALISKAELAAMNPKAWIVNVGRGPLIDSKALLEALTERKIGGAFLDVTDPEPLPADDLLWSAPNAIITMHLSGRTQNGLFRRAAKLFIENLQRYAQGERLTNEVDLAALV